MSELLQEVRQIHELLIGIDQKIDNFIGTFTLPVRESEEINKDIEDFEKGKLKTRAL